MPKQKPKKRAKSLRRREVEAAEALVREVRELRNVTDRRLSCIQDQLTALKQIEERQEVLVNTDQGQRKAKGVYNFGR